MAERNLVKFPPGTIIFTEGGIDYKMYLIRNGWVKVSKGRRTIAQLGPGEPVGEMSLLLDEPHSATVKAVNDVEATEITGKNFEDIVLQEPGIGWTVMRFLAARLRDTTAAYATLSERSWKGFPPEETPL